MSGTFFKELGYGVRQLVKTPGFTTVTVIALALGIGANTAIFSMVNAVLLQPLPYDDGDRLVVVRQRVPGAGLEDVPFSVAEINDYAAQNQTLDGLAEYHSMWFTLLGRGEPQRVQTGVVSANFFDILGTRPALGRFFLSEDEKAGAPPVLILSHAYWRQKLGGDAEVIGRTFEMNEKIHTVVGVLEPIPQFPDENDVYMPTSACPFRSSETFIANRNARMMQVFSRLKPGVSLEQAGADVSVVASRLLSEYPEVYDDGAGYDAGLHSLREVLVGDAGPRLWILLFTVGLVQLITCANLANLIFARQLGRQREIAIRSSLGANRSQLLRLYLTESTLLALLGGALGLLLAAGVLNVLTTFASRFTSRASEIDIDLTVLLFALGVSIATGIAIGGMSALSLRGNLVSALKEGSGRGTGAVGLQRLRNGLVVAQVAVCFILLSGAGLAIRSLAKLQSVDTGFDSSQVLTAQLSLSFNRYDSPAKRIDFFSRVLEELNVIPGVSSVAASRSIPLDQAATLSRDFEIEGRPPSAGQVRPNVDVRFISEDFFKTVGVELLSGRYLARTDDQNASSNVVVINQSLVRLHFNDQNPVGKRITTDRGQTWYTVVGVVADIKHQSLESEAAAEIYRTFRQSSLGQMNLLLRTTGDPTSLVEPLRRTIREIDPDQPLTMIQTLDQVRRTYLAAPRLTVVLLSLCAGLALVIAAAGLGGVISYMVGQQTREIGVRMALGAQRFTVLWSVLRGVLLLVAGGLTVGVASALYLTRLMSSLLFGVHPQDFITFLTVALLLSVVAAVACLVPARHATRIDPVVALRTD